MLIQAPLNRSIEPHIEELIGMGADEFYFGYISRFEHASEVISRRQGPDAHFPTLESTGPAIRRITDMQKKVFVTINEHHYTGQAFRAILDDIDELLQHGVSGFIITDTNLLMEIRNRHPEAYLVASTGCHITNTGAAKHYRALGMNRIILTRHLTTREINAILRDLDDMDFEIFAKNEDCANIDGLCFYVHGNVGGRSYGHSCKRTSIYRELSRQLGPDGLACGACRLFDLRKHRNLVLKIVGRDAPVEFIRKDIEFLRNVLDALENIKDPEVFSEECRGQYRNLFGMPCNNRCYYRSIHEEPRA